MENFKPPGHNSASPYLVLTHAAATIRFLERVLDGELLMSVPGEAGRVMHAEVRIDDTVVMLADAAPNWPAVAAHVHVYVRDVDATYTRALSEGAASVQAPQQKGDEDKRGGVKDEGGTTWWIATRIGQPPAAA
jgi:PhnB protein